MKLLFLCLLVSCRRAFLGFNTFLLQPRIAATCRPVPALESSQSANKVPSADIPDISVFLLFCLSGKTSTESHYFQVVLLYFSPPLGVMQRRGSNQQKRAKYFLSQFSLFSILDLSEAESRPRISQRPIESVKSVKEMHSAMYQTHIISRYPTLENKYIEVQNQVKYGGQMHFFSSRGFRKLLNTKGQKWFCHKISVLE